VSGQPHDDRRSEQPDPELDRDQHVDEADSPSSGPQQRPEDQAAPLPVQGPPEPSADGIVAPPGWELDDESDATINLPAIRAHQAGNEAESHATDGAEEPAAATARWEALLAGRAGDEPAAGDDAAEADETASGIDPDETTILAPVSPDVTATATPDSPEQDSTEPEDTESDETEEGAEDETVTATAVAAPAAAPSGPVNAEGLPLRPRDRGRRSAKPAKKNHTLMWALLSGLLVVLVAVALILYFTLRDHDDEKITGGSTVESMPTSIQKGSPAAAVRDLGTALKDGDAKAALDLLQVSALQGSNDQHPLLSNAVYAKTKNRPESITPAKESYGVPASDALTAGVTATVTQEGKEQDVSLRLTRADADAPWKVATASLPALDVTDGGAAQVAVNGAKVKLPGSADDYSTHRLFVLPGDYSLKRTNSTFVNYPKTKSFKVSATALAADPDAKTTDLGSLSLEGTLNSAFKKEADKSVTEWLDKCVASTELAPKNCPFGADADGNTVTDIKWTLDKEPTLSYPDLTVSNATVEGKDGQASVKAKVKQDGDDATLTADVPVDFSGTLQVKGKDVVFTFGG
jgi:hypothetical protein